MLNRSSFSGRIGLVGYAAYEKECACRKDLCYLTRGEYRSGEVALRRSDPGGDSKSSDIRSGDIGFDLGFYRGKL